MVDSSYDDIFLKNKKDKPALRKQFCPDGRHKAALKTSCLDISDHSLSGVLFGMPGLQSPAVARVFRQFCKRYSVEEGDRSLLIYYPIKRLACQEGNCNNFKKKRDFFCQVWEKDVKALPFNSTSSFLQEETPCLQTDLCT